MYNEVKRFYLFRRRRWADTLFDTLYHVIFILGFYSLLRGNSDFQLSYFYYYFILTHVVSLGNEELEYEILGNLLVPSMLCNQCIEFTCNEQWFTLFGCL